MKQSESVLKNKSNRRSFLKKGAVAAGVTVGAGLLTTGISAFARERSDADDVLTRGDIAILRFLAAAELIESDLWQQYNELGGVNATGSKSQLYLTALQVLDGDMPQYVNDNTEDEFSHAAFLNAYLKSKGQQEVSLAGFGNLAPSQVSTVPQTGRLTNLKQLSVDTSWWTRYRGKTNPDLGAKFAQAVPSLNVGQHPAIPLTDDDLRADAHTPNGVSNHLQAIANTAGFHFGFIEQGGTSLYAALAQKVSSLEVLRILLSIGGSEIMHFQVWHDKAGNAPVLTDGSLSFPDLSNSDDPTLKANLIMPEPCEFLDDDFPLCAIIRPTSDREGGAAATIRSFVDDGLFIGQPRNFLELLFEMAHEADQARREL